MCPRVTSGDLLRCNATRDIGVTRKPSADLNNGRYAVFLCGFFPGDIKERCVISFGKEVTMG